MFDAAFHAVLSNNCSTPFCVSYQSCPSTGFTGAFALAKFSNTDKKFSAIICPYPVTLRPGNVKLVSWLDVLSKTVIGVLFSLSVKFTIYGIY